MTLTEVTTDFTSGAALGSCLSPGAHGSELGCLLGNPGVLPPSSPGWPGAAGSQTAPALDHYCLGGAWWGGTVRGIQGLILFWGILLLTIVRRRLGCSLGGCVGSHDEPSPWGCCQSVGGGWVGLANSLCQASLASVSLL